jgi:hypothetical protein
VNRHYCGAITDSTQPATGSLDGKTRRIAWTIGDRQGLVHEPGRSYLTQEQTTPPALLDENHTEQYGLFRVEQTTDQGAEPKQ